METYHAATDFEVPFKASQQLLLCALLSYLIKHSGSGPDPIKCSIVDFCPTQEIEN